MATKAGASSESTTQTLTLLDRIIAEGRMAHDESQQDYARDMLAEFATQVLDEGMAIDKDTVAMINDRISQIDKLISDQLNEVLHHPDMQKLEASWRGLHMLVDQTETSSRLKLRLLNVTQKELQNDLEKAVEFDQSSLFKKIYEEEYGIQSASGRLCIRPPSTRRRPARKALQRRSRCPRAIHRRRQP
jgi:type VI secretion system protein ImpC